MSTSWMGYFVMAFVWFWMALVGLVLLRTGLFLAALLWMGVRQWYDDLRLRRT